jgi:predicted acetyltransferase
VASVPDVDVSLDPAADSDWPAVERLTQLYLHDLSSSRGYLPDQRGVFDLRTLALFRTDPGRQAWMIRTHEHLAGFALTRPWEKGGTSMYAFFVVRALRSNGVGRVAARELLHRIPGEWGIAFQDANTGAREFWEQVARDVVGERFRVDEPELGQGPPDVWIRLDSRVSA